MAFVTEYEKRCAAERLRGLPDYETANVVVRTCLGLRPGVLMDKGTRRRMGDFVADLIDPDCDEDRYEGLRTARPVDREALLALADELDETARKGKASEGWTASVVLAISRYADRIREACGETANGLPTSHAGGASEGAPSAQLVGAGPCPREAGAPEKN